MASKDYKNAKIYKILNTIDDDVYVGSTCQPLSKRMAKHRESMNDKTKIHGNMKIYQKMRELGKEHFYIELVEECPCDNLEQLRAREGHHIRQIGTLNKLVAGRSKQEFDKLYYQNNKDKVSETNNKWKESHPEKVKEMKAKWYQEHKEEMLEKFKQKYEEGVRVKCRCGGKYVSHNRNAHFKTKLHQACEQANPQD